MSRSAAARPPSRLAAGPIRHSRLAGPAVALAVMLAGGWVAAEAHAGQVLDALPDSLRAGLAIVVLFGLTGYPVARVLAPRAVLPHLTVLVLPVGAASGSLALTVLGFLHLPFDLSLTIVIAAGAAGSLVARRQLGPARAEGGEGAGGRGLRLFWPAWLAIGLVTLTLVPAFRVGMTTTLGQNPDAHLVTGAAEVVRAGPPKSVQPQLPVDRVSPFWQSKYPIYYSLAGISSLSGLDPVQVFPVLSGALLALFGAGVFLLAFYALGAGPVTSLVAMGVVPLDRTALYLVEHPYYNQLWGTFALPFMLLFGFRFLREPGRRSGALFLLFFLLGVFAYPLMLPFPAVALGVAAFVLWRRARAAGEPVGWVSALDLPSLRGRRLLTVPLGILGGLVMLRLAVAGLDKGIAASKVIVGGSLNGWQGDSPHLPFARYFGVPEPTVAAILGLALVAIGAALALRREPRPERLGLLVMIAGALLMAADFHSRTYGEYFEFKVLAFLGPVVLTLAIVGLGGLRRGTRARAGPALAVAGLGLLAVTSLANARDELDSVTVQAPREVFQLRAWSHHLPDGASIRIDVPPSGVQLWAAYMLHTHPLSATIPVTHTTYPELPAGRKADYLLVGKGPTRPGDAVGRPLFGNALFLLYRMDPSTPGPDRSSRTRIQPSPGIKSD